jgi:hypothetical protein
MRRLQLYIGTERVDLFKDETVSLTQTIKNVKDLAKVFTEFTQTFSVPASSVNNKIFRHYYNFDISNGFDARKKADARIELNDLPFKDGKIALQGVELKNNVAHTYKITFFGNTVNLKDILGDAELSSLSFSDYYNRDYDFATVTDVMQDGVTPFIVPLITHTKRLIYNSVVHTQFNPEDTINNIYPHGSGLTNHNNGVEWNQFKYAVRLQTIIDAIETKYNIAFSDDFFNNVNNEQFATLFMWLHRKSGSVDRPTQVEVIQTKLQDLIVKTGSDEKISTVENGIITVNAPIGVFPATLKLELDPSDDTITYNVQVLKNSGTVIGELNGVQGNETINISAGPDGLEDNSTYLIQFSGVGLSFAINAIDVTINWIDGFNNTTGSDTYHNEFAFTTSDVFEFNIVEQLPKMKIIDFLSGLFNMFNLTAYVNDVGTIVVRTLDSYYADSTQVYNIDKYLDTTKSTSDIALPFNEISFSYKGLGTLLAKQFEQLTNSGWGSLSYTLNGGIYDAPSEAYKIELPFEHMQFERLYDAGQSTTTSTDIQWGYSVNENLQSYIGEPLLFYAIGIVNGDPIRIRNTVNDSIEDITDYVIPSNSQALSPSTNKFNIHFQNELNEYLANEPTGGGLAPVSPALQFTDTLFETEYKEYIQDVFNFRRRLLKVTAYLPMKVYYNLKLNDLIEIGQDSYKINSMKTDLTSGKTEFELLNNIQL